VMANRPRMLQSGLGRSKRRRIVAMMTILVNRGSSLVMRPAACRNGAMSRHGVEPERRSPRPGAFDKSFF
jgi:hypothetical protein